MKLLFNSSIIGGLIGAIASGALAGEVEFKPVEDQGKIIFDNNDNLISEQIHTDFGQDLIDFIPIENQARFKDKINENSYKSDFYLDVILPESYSNFQVVNCVFYQWDKDLLAVERISHEESINTGWFSGEVYEGVSYVPSLVEIDNNRIHVVIGELFDITEYVRFDIRVSYVFNKIVSFGVPTERCYEETGFIAVFGL